MWRVGQTARLRSPEVVLNTSSYILNVVTVCLNELDSVNI